ncbi:MAG TPA: S8 family serine peptidase [Longimicrobiales bacterium]|nr:S8 family serine peptidase [Longimicrobiales bacterium]
MTRARFSLAICLLLCAAPLAAQEPWVDPRLRLLELRPDAPIVETPGAPDEGQARTRGGLLARDRTRSPLSLHRGPDGQPRVGLLVEVRSPAALAAIRATGAEVGRVVGRIATVRAPLSAIPALSRLTSISRIEAARPFTLHNDSAMSASRVDEARRLIGASFLGSTGRGVLVGVLDTGLDYTHDDFLDADGVPRTLFLWDQVTRRMCGPDQLRARACVSGDTHGHGTHVAGIAAGDGSATGADSASAFRYAGVAPEADIMAVRFSFRGEDDLIDGVAWMFEKADSMGLPAVINISLGTQVGPHDGTSLMEAALDSLSGPGRIIVTSAGNDGNARNTSPRLLEVPVHARAVPGPGTTETITFRVTAYSPSNDTCNDFVFFDLWYGGDQAVTFEVVRPGGTSASASTGGEVVENHPEGRIVIVAPGAPYPGNGDHNAQIEVSGCGTSGAPAPGTWTIRLSSADVASEPLDLWMAGFRLGQDGWALGQSGFDNAYAISTPATAREVIAVGAYASRLCWPAASGGTPCIDDVFGFTQPIGDIAFFSSPGPTRDGRLKPDIAAPGMMIMAARSEDAFASTRFLAPSREHRVELGTSMSAPHVAGAVALLLQHDPGLTPAEVIGILTSTAASDAYTHHDYSDGSTGLPNEQWGWGKLDARAALETLVDPAVASELWLSVRSDTLPLGAVLDVRAIVINAFGDSLAGPDSWTPSDPGVATVTQDGVITPVALGTTTVTAAGSGFSESVFIEVVPPATLIVEASPLAPAAEDPSSRAGTHLPLLDLRLIVDGHEGVLVDTLGFGLIGADPAARFVLVDDRDDDGVFDANERVLADTTLALGADSIVVVITPDLVVPAMDTLNLIAVLVLSGAVPNGATFQGMFLPELTSSHGLRSGALDLRTDPAAVVASAPTSTTVLSEDELFNLSENPIRSDARRLVLNFGAPPTSAAIYTLRGARVADLMPLLEASGQRIEWDLRTDRGGVVAPGIYFLIVRIGDGLVRRKLIVARAFGAGDA